MNSRDTILLAVLINAALLSMLFVTATRPDREPVLHQPASVAVVQEAPPAALNPASGLRSHFTRAEEPASHEELSVPKEQLAREQQMREQASQEHASGLRDRFEETKATSITVADRAVESGSTAPAEAVVEVTVKRGDFLEKIARANGSNVADIKRLNNLANDRIDVGQVLLIPVADKSRTVAPIKPIVPSEAPKEARPGSEVVPEYYTMRPGDNPWNIARQHRVNFDDFLRLNDLDEEKARQLKPGDKLRVR